MLARYSSCISPTFFLCSMRVFHRHSSLYMNKHDSYYIIQNVDLRNYNITGVHGFPCKTMIKPNTFYCLKSKWRWIHSRAGSSLIPSPSGCGYMQMYGIHLFIAQVGVATFKCVVFTYSYPKWVWLHSNVWYSLIPTPSGCGYIQMCGIQLFLPQVGVATFKGGVFAYSLPKWVWLYSRVEEYSLPDGHCYIQRQGVFTSSSSRAAAKA